MTIRAPIFLLIIVIMIMVIPQVVKAEVQPGTFTHPKEREDGTLLRPDEIKSYRVYQNDSMVKELLPTATSFEIDLLPGTYNINMTTVDTDLRESARSNTLVVVVLSGPKSPVLIQIGR